MLIRIFSFFVKNSYALGIFTAVFVTSAIFLQVPTLFANDGLIHSGGDFTFEIFITKLASEGNLLGISKNVGWPSGFSVWSNPAFGFGPYYLSLIISFIFESLNVYQLYFLVLSFGLALSSFCGYWMVEKEFSSKYYPLLIGLLIGFSPFGLMRIGHMPVAWFYFPVLFIGVVFRLNRGEIKKLTAFLILAIGGIFSPLWWTLATLLISVFIFMTTLLKRQRFKQDFENWITISMGISVAVVPTFFLMVLSRSYSGEGSRYPWQSDIFGGRFTDLALSSPFLNDKFNLIEKLKGGTSPEGSASFIGLLLGASVVLLIIYLINESNYSLDTPKDLKKLSLITLLFFIAGGLGNLQAGIFVLFDQVSPARAWFRLGIILGILGLYVLFKFIESSEFSKLIVLTVSIMFISISILDLSYTQRKNFSQAKDLVEYSPTKFLEAKTKKCPVLQIPIDTYPLMQDFLGQEGDKFLYSQMIPYTLSSNNKWSLVATPNNDYWKTYKEIPTEINSENVKYISQNGYCAILFDKDFSSWQIERNAGLDFIQGAWPGLRVNLQNVDFENERYQVYLLSKN